MFTLRAPSEPQHRLADKLPWERFVADGVLLHKDDTLQTTFRFRGPDLASASKVELALLAERFNDSLKRLGSGWALFAEARRMRAPQYPVSAWPTDLCELIEEERVAHFEGAGAQYESRYYLTLTWRMPSAAAGWIESIFFAAEGGCGGFGEGGGDALQRHLHYFVSTAREIAALLRAVLPDFASLNDEETLTYLHGTISSRAHAVRVPEDPVEIGTYLTDDALVAGDVPMLGDQFLPCCTVKGFPTRTWPGLLDALNALGVEYRWMTRFICMDRAEAEQKLSTLRRHWFTRQKSIGKVLVEAGSGEESKLLDKAAEHNASDADEALEDLGADRVAYGYLTSTVVVWDAERAAALHKLEQVTEAIEKQRFVVRRETLHAAAAWLGSLPGNTKDGVRRPIISSRNLAHIVPASAPWAGDEENSLLKKVCGVGAPLIVCAAKHSPYRLHLNVGGVQHGLAIGPTGSGKSVLGSTLATHWQKYPEGGVTFFDLKRSARCATLAHGGAFIELGKTGASALQPFGRVDEPEERLWAHGFVLRTLTLQGCTLTPARTAAVDATLESIAGTPRRNRTFTEFAKALGSRERELRDYLRPYTAEGPFGHLFDAASESFPKARWKTFELGPLMKMGDRASLPALDYLFRRIEDDFDGRPWLVPVDEAWRLFLDDFAQDRLIAWLKTLRDRNVAVLLLTQELADIADKQRLFSAVVQAAKTKILLPNQDARVPSIAQWYASIGLTPKELDIVAKAVAQRDYYYRSPLGRRLFSLELGPIERAIVGSSAPDDHAFLDAMIATRDPEDYAAAILEHKGFVQAAERLRARRPSRLTFPLNDTRGFDAPTTSLAS